MVVSNLRTPLHSKRRTSYLTFIKGPQRQGSTTSQYLKSTNFQSRRSISTLQKCHCHTPEVSLPHSHSWSQQSAYCHVSQSDWLGHIPHLRSERTMTVTFTNCFLAPPCNFSVSTLSSGQLYSQHALVVRVGYGHLFSQGRVLSVL
jgi:hypothetical protein